MQSMHDELDNLIEAARSVTMTLDERATQRESFAFGNANIENEFVTRDMVREAASKLPLRDG